MCVRMQEACACRHALRTLTQKQQNAENKAGAKIKETNNLTCFKTEKLLNPRLLKHIKA